VNLAVDEINNNGGVNGRMIKLYIEDDRTDPKQAVSAFRKLVDVDRVDGVIGGMFDFAVQPVFPIAESTQTPIISPTNFRIEGGFELNDYSYVMYPDFSKVIRELKGYLAKTGSQKLAVIHFNSVFGKEIAKTLGSVMAEMGKGPIIDESYNQIGGNDFKTTILKLKGRGVDTVFLDMVDVDPVNFLSRSRELGFSPNVISYEAIRDSFASVDADRSLLEGVVILNWEYGPEDFVKKYQERYEIDPVKSADKSYAAIYVLVQAIANTSSHDAVSPFIATNEFATPYGIISFNRDHAVETTPVRIDIIKDGQLTTYSTE
jgi:branched-chain amino acid transport system substrate-binding protein